MSINQKERWVAYARENGIPLSGFIRDAIESAIAPDENSRSLKEINNLEDEIINLKDEVQ